MEQLDCGRRLYRWVWLSLWAVLIIGCGNNPFEPVGVQMYKDHVYSSTKEYNDFESLVKAMDKPEKVHQWLYYYTEYNNDYNGGWTEKSNDRTEVLAKYIFKHRKGRCAQYAALYVYCARYHGYTSGFIVDYGHCWGWVVENGKVSLTSASSSRRKYKKDVYENLDEMFRVRKRAILLDSYYKEIKKDERI